MATVGRRTQERHILTWPFADTELQPSLSSLMIPDEGVELWYKTLRKNRCDQSLPACSLCAKAGATCVGFDPVTKREIPRTYVYYLESRLNYLETLLTDNGIPFASSCEFDLGAKPSSPQGQTCSNRSVAHTTTVPHNNTMGLHDFGTPHEAPGRKDNDEDKLNDLVSNISMASVGGATDRRYLGIMSGISFARVVSSAVKSSVAVGSSGKGSSKASKPAATASGTPVRDSLFGLYSTPSVQPASFPDRALGLQMVTTYFSFSNPQLPILHKGEFMSLFDRAYASTASHRSARELYMLNIVFAIGTGIFLEGSHPGPSPDSSSTPSTSRKSASLDAGKLGAPSQQYQAEEYHAAAMMHLESFSTSASAMDCPDGFSCGLEELQAVLLLAGFALLRPVAPGLWYIVGVATRLGVDLGLHHEYGTDLDGSCAFVRQHPAQGQPDVDPSVPGAPDPHTPEANERGRREWMRDLRRRLWWCVYSFDRLVSTCVGRPLGITDQVITTDFPALLNDEQITRSGFAISYETFTGPTYKRVSHHYFRLRLLQSEIHQVLEYRQATQTRVNLGGNQNPHMHARLSSSFLQPFESFEMWRHDIDRRLYEWKNSAPLQEDTAVPFDVRFFELNYWQMIIMLYRQSLGAEPQNAGPAVGSGDGSNSMARDMNDDSDDEDVYLKVAEAGQRVLTLDDVDFTVLAATSVLGDLSDKCPPAEACRDAFERMSKATVKMCLSTTGFGSPATLFKTQHRHGMHQDGLAANDAPVQLEQQSLPRRQPRNNTSLGDYVDNENLSGLGLNSRFEERQANSETIEAPQTLAYVPTSDGNTSEQPTTDSAAAQSNPPSNLLSLGFDDHLDEAYDALDSDLLLTSDESTGYDTEFGSKLGFGSEQDWSDGMQLDIFDGFFFGGNAGSSVASSSRPFLRPLPHPLQRHQYLLPLRLLGRLEYTETIWIISASIGLLIDYNKQYRSTAAMAPLPSIHTETTQSHSFDLRSLLSSSSSLSPRSVLSRVVRRVKPQVRSYTTQPVARKFHSIVRRQQAPPRLIPTTYAGLNRGPTPGTVVGIVLGSVAGFLLILWLIYTCVNFNAARGVSTYDEETVVRRRSRSPRSSRRSPSRHAPSRSRSRSEVIEVSRHRSPPRRETRRETVIMEERNRPPPPPVEREDDIVEVIEEHSPVRRSSGSRRVSGYRTVDPEAYGGGNRPMRKVSRR
ncbi:MAG: hypothetical protein Q9178_003894 [Gyalolechia marmorata]